MTAENLYPVLRLRTTKEQEKFVATNAASLAEAAYNRHAWPRAIYAGETPVGFVMLSDNPDEPEYYLWRLMVDHRYQRLGFGRRALEQVIDYVCGRPNAATLLVSYVPGEGSPSRSMLGWVLWTLVRFTTGRMSCTWTCAGARGQQHRRRAR